MNYMLQIYSGDASSAWEGLSEEEQNAVMGEYAGIYQTAGVTGGAYARERLRPQLRIGFGFERGNGGPFACNPNRRIGFKNWIIKIA